MGERWIEVKEIIEISEKISIKIRWSPKDGRFQIQSPELRKGWTEIKGRHKQPEELLEVHVRDIIKFDFHRLPSWLQLLTSEERTKKNREAGINFLNKIGFKC